jgi:hypothetical protein
MPAYPHAALALHRATGRLSRRARAFEAARTFGRPHGVLWLRDVLRTFGVGKLSDLPTATLEALTCPDHPLNARHPAR